jgi:hypothetical protein
MDADKVVFVGVVLALVALLIFSFVGPSRSERTALDVTFRVVDCDAKVVCWLTRANGGLSCLPIAETALDNSCGR